jgi:ribosome-binding protein aMBF1 (putative translation factor)
MGEGNPVHIDRGYLLVCKQCFAGNKKTIKLPKKNAFGTAGRKSGVSKAQSEDNIGNLEPIPNLGDTIKKRRLSLGFRISDLALKSGIKESLIRKVENEKITLPEKSLNKLERVLGIHLKRLSDQGSEPLPESNLSTTKEITLGDILKTEDTD